jgi:hypothetical protein
VFVVACDQTTSRVMCACTRESIECIIIYLWEKYSSCMRKCCSSRVLCRWPPRLEVPPRFWVCGWGFTVPHFTTSNRAQTRHTKARTKKCTELSTMASQAMLLPPPTAYERDLSKGTLSHRVNELQYMHTGCTFVTLRVEHKTGRGSRKHPTGAKCQQSNRP